MQKKLKDEYYTKKNHYNDVLKFEFIRITKEN